MLDLPNHSLPLGTVVKKGISLYTQIFTACLPPIVVMALLCSLPKFFIKYVTDDFLSSTLLILVITYLCLAPYVLALYRSKSILEGSSDEFEVPALKVIKDYYFPSLIPYTIMIVPMFAFILISYYAQTFNAMISFLSLPVAYFLLLVSFGVVLLVLDNEEPMNAVKKSIKIVFGRWWRTFGIIFVLLSLPQLTVALLALILSFGINWLAELIQIVGIIAILPLSIAALIVLSHDLKQRARETEEQIKFEAEQEAKKNHT